MELPKGGLIGKTVEFIRYLGRLKISVYAANASFFIILSIFPTLLLLLGLLRYTGMDAHSLSGLVEAFLPEVFVPSARHLILNAYRNSSGALISVSALIATWSAGRGIHGLLQGLNRVYGVRESRGYFATRWLSIRYTMAFLAVLLSSLFLQFTRLDQQSFLGWLLGQLNLRFLVLLALQTFLFTAMYVVLPNQKIKIVESLPGAVLASLGWSVFSRLYSVYVEHFSSYTNIYGSVYSLALSMLWLYCCVTILFYGGLLNRFLKERKFTAL